MNCERCNVPMKIGYAIPSPPECFGFGWGTVHLQWPFQLEKVLKCPSCGRSLSKADFINNPKLIEQESDK